MEKGGICACCFCQRRKSYGAPSHTLGNGMYVPGMYDQGFFVRGNIIENITSEVPVLRLQVHIYLLVYDEKILIADKKRKERQQRKRFRSIFFSYKLFVSKVYVCTFIVHVVLVASIQPPSTYE